MKKLLLLGVISFALIITSCNKYANDFQELKDQIKLLGNQLSTLTEAQAKAAAAQVKLSDIQSAITSATSGLATSASLTTLTNNLSTLSETIGGIKNTLDAVRLKGEATKNVVDQLAIDLKKVADDATAQNNAINEQVKLLTDALPNAATKSDLANLQQEIVDKITAASFSTDTAIVGQIARLKAKIEADIANSASETNGLIADLQQVVTDGNAANILAINAARDALLGGPSDTQTSATITGLSLALAHANTILDILLNNAAMYNGDVIIKSDADAAGFLLKINQLAIINGYLVINTNNDVTAAGLADIKKILKSVIAVIGTATNYHSIDAGFDEDGFDLTFAPIAGEPNGVLIASKPGEGLDAEALTSVRGTYQIVGAPVGQLVLKNVGMGDPARDVILDYDGDYVADNLALVGRNLILHQRLGNGNISFKKVIIGGFVGDGSHAPNTLVSFPAVGTTSIDLFLETQGSTNGLAAGEQWGQLNQLNADNALAIKLGTIAYKLAGHPVHAGLIINTKVASQVDLLAAHTSAGPITITLQDGATWKDGLVDLNNFNSNVHVTINGPTYIEKLDSWYGDIPGSLLIGLNAHVVTLAKYQWLGSPLNANTGGAIPADADLPIVHTITLKNLVGNFDLDHFKTHLQYAILTGRTPDPYTWDNVTAQVSSTATAGAGRNSVLKSLIVDGILTAVDVSHKTLNFTELVTSGSINAFTLHDVSSIIGATLDHTAFNTNAYGAGGPGSDFTVTDNALLSTLAPSKIDWMHTLTVTGNGALESFNFSSYVTVNFTGSTDVLINAPTVMGNYWHSVLPIAAGNPPKQAEIHSDDIMTLKNYIIAYMGDVHITPKSFSINIGVYDKTNADAVTTLDAVMTFDSAPAQLFPAGYTNLVTSHPLNLVSELPLVVAQP